MGIPSKLTARQEKTPERRLNRLKGACPNGLNAV